MFGSSLRDAAVGSDNRLLTAARLKQDGLLIVRDVPDEFGLDAHGALLFGDQVGPVRFAAVVQVGFEGVQACGLLVVAAAASHVGLTLAQKYVLRAHAAQISALLELHTLRGLARQEDESGNIQTQPTALLEAILASTNDGILITQAEAGGPAEPRIVHCSAAFARMMGHEVKEIIGRTPSILLSNRTHPDRLTKLYSALSRQEPFKVDRRTSDSQAVQKDRTGFSAELKIIPVSDPNSDFTQWVLVQRDMSDRRVAEAAKLSAQIAEKGNAMLEEENAALEAELQERKRVEARLNYVAFHDELTALHNRQFFIDRLASAIERTTIDNDFKFAVMLLDLDRFKTINDSFGHRSGDLMLIEVAERLRSCVQPQDVVARIGGDEFAVLVEAVTDANFPEILAKKIVDLVGRPMQIGGQEIYSSCSVGTVQATPYYRLPEELLRDADIAMYQAKRRDAGYTIFDASMHKGAIIASQLRTELLRAVTRREFYVEYQPIYDSVSRNIIGVEALIRWQHPKRGALLPGEFIGAAEEMGLIRQIGSWILQEACTQMRLWHQEFPDLDLRLNVNISGHQLSDSQFIQQLKETLATTGLEPKCLQLEVTESVFFPSADPIENVISSARALGVRVALDDFGTGYSSLSYLDRYPIDTIKIDQSFVAGLPDRERTVAIVKAIIALGQALNLEIVAEGIEDIAQLQALTAMGCSYAQGFFLCHPAPPEKISRLIKTQTLSARAR